MRTRSVPLDMLEAALEEAWADRARRPYVEGDVCHVPVREGFAADADLPERRPYRGRGYQMVGDIALVHGGAPSAAELEALVAWRRPRGVLLVEGFEGALRTPRTRLLWGECGEVVHREAGIRYRLDPATVMFAQGNREEKMRIATLVRPSERVADMFAGIGYFTLPAARAGARVHAMELNPAAFGYLEENVRENGLAERVRAECGDCRDLLDGPYDRIIMGHFDAPGMLEDAIAHAEPGTVLHVHSIGPAGDRIQTLIENAGYSWDIRAYTIKKYAPRRWHMVQDVILS
ncbi:MAG: methyltransferase domain-containing protein [Methanomicrobiaceae archaeon]|nr:methyltransferase domain-containing protein [Methanomicrobiaceae archaeon]